MASSKNDKYESAASGYNEAKNTYTGNAGYNEALKKADNGATIANKANKLGLEQSKTQNALTNEEARKYANQQAIATAAGAQSQATTAARAAGMNKAQAAMLGSQQNANAYQNAYGNAYNTQLGSANNNANSQISNYNANMNTQQQLAQQSGQAALGASGTQLSAGQQEGQNEYNRKNANWGIGLGLLTSDERLKHYNECSKRVIYKSPSKLKTLKIDLHKGE